jgi:hypothetical protein
MVSNHQTGITLGGLTLSEAGISFRTKRCPMRGICCSGVSNLHAVAAVIPDVTYLKDILLDPGHAGGEEDEGAEGDTAEHAGLDATMK